MEFDILLLLARRPGQVFSCLLYTSFDVLGVDYRGELPWEAAPQIAAAYDEARRQYEHIILLANSIGAYFTMLALGDQAPDRALFVSPVLDMERLILDLSLIHI